MICSFSTFAVRDGWKCSPKDFLLIRDTDTLHLSLMIHYLLSEEETLMHLLMIFTFINSLIIPLSLSRLIFIITHRSLIHTTRFSIIIITVLSFQADMIIPIRIIQFVFIISSIKQSLIKKYLNNFLLQINLNSLLMSLLADFFVLLEAELTQRKLMISIFVIYKQLVIIQKKNVI